MFIFIALGPDCDCGVRHALPASGCLLLFSLPSHTCLWVFGSASSEVFGFFSLLVLVFIKLWRGITTISLFELKFCCYIASSDSPFYAFP